MPTQATTAEDLLVVDALFDSLTAWDDGLATRPSVARRWTRRDGGRTWRFFLRRSARFSDGTRVRAGDFVRTWNELARNGRAHHHLRDVVGYADVRRGTAGRLRGVRAVDETTLEVRLVRPLAEFPAVVAHPALGPMRHPVASPAQRERPVGNGAFEMAEPWARGRFVRLTRRGRPPAPDATGATPLHEVVFQFADPASAYIAYEQGGVDVATIPPVALTAEEPPATPTTRYRGPGLLRGDLPTTYFLVCNVRRSPCRDVRARRGLTLALDRRRIVAAAFHQSAVAGWSATPPALPAFGRRTCLQCIHEPARARTLLARSGIERTSVWISTGGDHERVAEHIRADLARVGVSAQIKAVPFPRFATALRKGRPGLFRFGWTLDYPTADNALRPLFHSRGEANHTRYARRDVDRLLDRAAGVADQDRREALYRRAENLIVGRDQAVIPIAALRRRTVVADRVRDLAYGPMGTANLTRVRIVDPVPEE